MRLFIIFLAICGYSIAAHAQNGTADTIYVDVPAEVHLLRLQTTECISAGKKQKAKFGKRFLGCSSLQAICHNGEDLDRGKFKELFKNIQFYPYDKIVFRGFAPYRIEMDHPTEAGVIPALIFGKKPVIVYRREEK